MTDHDRSSDWSEVDAMERPDESTEYLETIMGLETVQAYKRRSHRLLRISEGDRIIDVGCGTGEDVLMLAEIVGPDGEVVGVDNSETMVETARENGTDVPMVRFTVDDALDLSFPDDSFDAARADRVLQHLDAPAEALAELRRVTRPGGRVGLSDPDWETMTLDAAGEYSEAFLSLEHAVTGNTTAGRQLYRRARNAGLVDIDIDTWTPISTDLEFISEAGSFDEWTNAMQSAGEATASEVEEWLDGLRRADQEDLLFGSVTGFTVVGTVPESDG